ncbi:hypothetical protein H0H93_005390 [Arthromyces matolae]|nr:hypothetical protein H0H93_005390 [Arthromyces matolae]
MRSQVRDLIDQLQRPIPDLSTLLSLLCGPLGSLNLLPPRYNRYNNPSSCLASAIEIRKHVPALQRALLEHIEPTWESVLAEKDALILLDQYFCPDSVYFTSPVAGDVAVMAYSTLTSTSVTKYSIHLLTRLAVEYPLDRLYSAIYPANQSVTEAHMLAWEDCFRSVLAVPGKVSNAIAGAYSIPHQLEHAESIITSLLAAIPSQTLSDSPSMIQRIAVKKESHLLWGITGPVVPTRVELWESTIGIILGRDWDVGYARIIICWLFGDFGGSLSNEKGHRIRYNVDPSLLTCATALEAFIEQVLTAWSSPAHIKHSLLSRHRCMWKTLILWTIVDRMPKDMTSLLLVAISYLASSSPTLISISLSPLLMSGIGLYLAHLDPSVRRCGMLVAEVVAQRASKTLDFGDWDGIDSGKPWAKELRELLNHRDCDARLEDLTPAELKQADHVDVEETVVPSTIAESTVSRVTLKAQPAGYDSDDSLTGYASPVSSRSASPTPSQLDAIEADPTLNVGAKKVPRPVYLGQLGDLLRNTGSNKSNNEPHDADRIEMALDSAEELIRKKRGYGTELDENAVNLVYALLGVQNNYELDLFDEKRQGALNALICCAPRKATLALIEEFFKNQYSMSQRYVALTALAMGAREMASLPVPPSTASADRISFPSKQLPAPLHKQYLGSSEHQSIPMIMDSISNLVIDKEKETSSDKVPELRRERRLRINKDAKITPVSLTPESVLVTSKGTLSQKLTPFIEVATEYFIAPLINHFWVFLRDERTREERTAHLQGRPQYHGAGTGLILNPVVLSYYLRTVAILVHAAQNAPEWMAVVAPDALELAVTIGAQPVSRIETDQEDDEAEAAQRGKEASILTAALELALVVLDGCLEIDGGRVISMEHTTLLLGTGEWAGDIFAQLEEGIKMQGGGGVHETKLRRAAAGVLLKIDDLTLMWVYRRNCDWLSTRDLSLPNFVDKSSSSVTTTTMLAARLPKRLPPVTQRHISSSIPRRSDALFVISFEFDAENMKRAQEIIARYPPQYKKAATIPLLDLGQRQNKGWTSISVMNYVAKLLEMPPMRVYEVATFYTMFNREPIGTHFVQVCTTTPCMLRGSTEILETCLNHAGGIKPGQTSKDGKFTVVEVECQGACSNAPMIVVGDDFYVSQTIAARYSNIDFYVLQEDLTPTTTKKVLDAFSKGEKPKPGPQSGRRTSENSAGLTNLIGKPYGPGEFCTPEFQ